MKKIIFAAVICAGVPAIAQKMPASKVPAAVVSAFQKKFTSIKEVSWEKEKGNYEANFKENGQKGSATFDASGNWLETEKGIASSALPKTVQDYIAKNCKGAAIHEAAVISKANGSTNYEANVMKKDYIFDAQGNFIKTEKD